MSTNLKKVLKDLQYLNSLKTSKKFEPAVLVEYPFDLQLLSASKLYRQSRKLYTSINGQYATKVCSTMRALSTQELTQKMIQYSPTASEYLWFKDNSHELEEPEKSLESLMSFSEVSVFHEQNHRILWNLLPPPPSELRDFFRYLNFAESIVVALDLALGDELGKETSHAFERLRIVYRPGGVDEWSQASKKEYRQYLMALVLGTYFLLEWMDTKDILKALNYVLPNQTVMNRQALKRSLELSENFSRGTNPEWQQRFGHDALHKLQAFHEELGNNLEADAWYLPEDPLDLDGEFELLDYVFKAFGL